MAEKHPTATLHSSATSPQSQRNDSAPAASRHVYQARPDPAAVRGANVGAAQRTGGGGLEPVLEALGVVVMPAARHLDLRALRLCEVAQTCDTAIQCPVRVRYVSGTCPVRVSDVSGTCPVRVSDVSGTCQ